MELKLRLPKLAPVKLRLPNELPPSRVPLSPPRFWKLRLTKLELRNEVFPKLPLRPVRWLIPPRLVAFPKLRFTKLDEPKLRLESPPRFRPVIPLLPRRELPIPPKFRLAKLAVAGLPRFAEIAPEP